MEKSNLLICTDNNIKYSTVAIGGWVISGSFNDGTCHGAHHFIEHLLFNNEEIKVKVLELKKRGIIYNAFTSHELTCFYIHCLKKDYEIGLDFVKTILCKEYKFENVKDFENEKNIILREIDYSNNKLDEVKNALLNKVFVDSKYAAPILGTEKSVRAMTMEALQKTFNQFYHHSNKFITVAGEVDVSEEETYAVNSYNKNNHEVSIQRLKSDAKLDFISTKNCYYGIAIYTPKVFRKEGQVYGVLVKNELLDQIRENLGAVYRIDSVNMNFYSGMVSFFIMNLKVDTIERVQPIVKALLNRKDEQLLELLNILHLQRMTQNSIKADNVVSKMLGIGYGRTILANEENEMNFADFLSYRNECDYYEHLSH